MFPTRYRTKIPSSLAYPASAKLVSELLVDVPQSQALSISFCWWRSDVKIQKRQMPFRVLRVGYSFSEITQFTPRGFEERGFKGPSWEIEVHAVPSVLKHHLKECLEKQGLPQVRDWFFEKRDLTGRQEHHSLTVLYNEGKDELEFHRHMHP